MKTKEQIEERIKLLNTDMSEDENDLLAILKEQERRVLGWVLEDEN